MVVRVLVCDSGSLEYKRNCPAPSIDSIRLQFELWPDANRLLWFCIYIWWSKLCVYVSGQRVGLIIWGVILYVYLHSTIWIPCCSSVFVRSQLINPKMDLHAKLVSAMRWRANPIKFRTWPLRARLTPYEIFYITFHFSWTLFSMCPNTSLHSVTISFHRNPLFHDEFSTSDT